MAPEMQHHFTEIYCDKASRLSPSRDDPCIWDLCSPINAYNNYSPHYHHHRRYACIYRCCVALLHNHSHVIIIQHLGQMEYIKP